MKVNTLCWKTVIAFLLLAAFAQAASVTNVVFTNGGYSGCNTPAPVANYQTTDPLARIWFTISNANAGDVAAVQWLTPGGGIFATSTFQPLSGGGSWCFGTTMSI